MPDKIVGILPTTFKGMKYDFYSWIKIVIACCGQRKSKIPKQRFT